MKQHTFVFIFSSILFILGIIIFFPIYLSNNLIFPYAIHPFNICKTYPILWNNIKFLFIIVYIFSSIIISNLIYIKIYKKNKKSSIINNHIKLDLSVSNFHLYVGYDEKKNNIYIPEKSLYQNILITGTIGTGKTSSAMYPFTRQLIEHNHFNTAEKIGMLILDVKGNYYHEVYKYAKIYNRLDDIIVIELNGKYKYNPLNKPNLKASVLAHRLKTILLLFSKNNTESYWLDEAEKILTECIKLCRLYNDNYVTFEEIHKLVTNKNYYLEKIQILRTNFLTQDFSCEKNYDLLSSITFLEEEYWKMDERTLSILKSEITRITNCFISDYSVSRTFNPKIQEENFHGFTDLINTGKIVVLNMNIAEYRNLSKIIATYLKLDFQTEVLSRLSKKNITRTVAFICDEYHEYVTLNDSDFFSQSREAKCINIVSTQSYSSLLNTLQDNTNLKVILQSLVNKLWFRSDDIFTIEEIQKQIGKKEKEKISKTISENSNDTSYNYLNNSFYSNKSNISESINQYFQSEFVYDTNYFTCNLQSFTCIAFISDGINIIPPQKINLIPYFKEREDI